MAELAALCLRKYYEHLALSQLEAQINRRMKLLQNTRFRFSSLIYALSLFQRDPPTVVGYHVKF